MSVIEDHKRLENEKNLVQNKLFNFLHVIYIVTVIIFSIVFAKEIYYIHPTDFNYILIFAGTFLINAINFWLVMYQYIKDAESVERQFKYINQELVEYYVAKYNLTYDETKSYIANLSKFIKELKKL